MNTKGRKGAGIDFAGLASMEPFEGGKPRTGVGMVTARIGADVRLEGENMELRASLAEVQAREFVVQLDSRRVRGSVFANRHAASFEGAEFALLRTEISEAGRNVQPIKVRPVKDSLEFDFEIVFGHRRHRACLELGLSVSAIVANLSDQELFSEMERENRLRANLSPYEQGAMYARALSSGLFPSARQLATSIGISNATVSHALLLVNLPPEVIEAFSSPLDLQFRWASVLNGALESDRESVLARAKRFSATAAKSPARDVLAGLLGESNAATDGRKLKVQGKTVGSVSHDPKGSLIIKVRAGCFSPAVEAAIIALIERNVSLT